MNRVFFVKMCFVCRRGDVQGVPNGINIKRTRSGDTEGAQFRKWGEKCSTGCTSFFLTFTVARPGTARSHGCFSSPRPLFVRLRAWHIFQGYP